MAAARISLLVVLRSTAASAVSLDEAQSIENDALEGAQSLRNIKAFYINLDNSTGRRYNMELQINETGLPAKRFPAVTFEDVRRGEFDDVLQTQGVQSSLAALGASANYTVACYLSHLLTLEEASKDMKPDQIALIMEDDISIPKDWRRQLLAVLFAAPSNWTFIKVCGWGEQRTEDMATPYSENRTAAWQRAVDMLESMVVPSEMREAPKFDFYAMKEPFIVPFMLVNRMRLWEHFYYAGTGAYLVRGSSISRVIQHLRSRPIADADSMLLSNGTFASYDVQPHPFGLTREHLSSSEDGFHNSRRRQMMGWLFGGDKDKDTNTNILKPSLLGAPKGRRADAASEDGVTGKVRNKFARRAKREAAVNRLDDGLTAGEGTPINPHLPGADPAKQARRHLIREELELTGHGEMLREGQ